MLSVKGIKAAAYNIGAGVIGYPARRRQHREVLAFYSQFIQPDAICFDIGANMGNRTQVFRELGASVIAVEPQNFCMKFLQQKFSDDNKVVLIKKALGAEEGTAEMMLSDATTVSTLSKDWVREMSASGRFGNCKWDKKETVPVTTFDSLIAEYGFPAFCKIDVEGYEFEVLKGLTQPVGTISLEYASELIKNTISCVNYLAGLGEVKFNYSEGEEMELVLPEWVNAGTMSDILQKMKGTAWGDIYARFQRTQ